MPYTATIRSLPRAFAFVKAMQADGLDWSEGFRPATRQAIAEILELEMKRRIDLHLEQIEADEIADRRNGYYKRRLLTELGDIELNVPRTRRYSPIEVVRAYARRTREIDRVILSGFVLGLSTRKVGEALLAILGRPVSRTTVSDIAKTLDAAVAAFHARALHNRYKVLMLDGVMLARKTGRRASTAGACGFGAARRWQKGSHRLPSGRQRKRGRMGKIPGRSLSSRAYR